MPDNRQLLTLFESLSHQDWTASKAAALRIAEGEEERGHMQAARKLRGALNGVGTNGHSHGPTASSSSGEFLLSKALVRAHQGSSLSDVALRPPMRALLREILEEWHAASHLQKAGVPRRSRLLFYGPPGCGKTITALALAREMKVPAYVVRFDALIGSYLGQTAMHLREIFQFASQNRCVLLLDEIDVLGKRRGSQMDVGELDRIVVGLMQELDLTRPRGLIIGASNLSSHLDDALWRRFDLRMEFKAPTKREIQSFLKIIGGKFGVRLPATLKGHMKELNDYASAEKLVINEVRRKIVRQHVHHAS